MCIMIHLYHMSGGLPGRVRFGAAQVVAVIGTASRCSTMTRVLLLHTNNDTPARPRCCR